MSETLTLDLAGIVRDISYGNAKRYFGFAEK